MKKCFVFFLVLLSMACGQSANPQATHTRSTPNAIVLATLSDLPSCDSSTSGFLYYVQSDEKFRYCDGTNYQVINLVGPQGSAGSDGQDGTNGSNGTDAACAGDPAPVVTLFTMSSGIPYTATVNVNSGGANPLHYSFMGEGGYYTQIGSSNQFTFTPNVSGGPFNNYVLVDDGCQIAWGSIVGLYTPPGDVSAVSGTPGSHQANLAWTNPTDTNFDHVEITCTGTCTGFSGPVDVAKPGTSTPIPGLTSGLSYTFTIKAMDAHSSRSAGVSVSVTPS